MTNDTLTLLKTRRSTPPLALAAPGPDAAQLEALLTVASRVPDHGKLAPWRFIVLQGEGRERGARIVRDVFVADRPEATEAQVDLEYRRLLHAPLVICVVSRAAPHPKIPEWEQILSAGAVCQNLLVASAAMGFGAMWLTNWFAFDRRVLSALGLAEGEKVAGFIHVGTKTAPQEDRPRPALADIVTHF